MTHNIYGSLQFSGILLNCDNEINYLLRVLTNDEDECISQIKKLDGQFSLIWETESFYITATDFSLTRFLYHGRDSITMHPVPDSELITPNSINVYDKNLMLKKSIVFFENYSAEATLDTFTSLIDSIEKTIYKLSKKSNPLTLFLSEGVDSGFLHCALLKNNISFDAINYQRYPTQPILLSIIKKRMQIHKQNSVSNFTIIYEDIRDDGIGPEYKNPAKATPIENIVLVGCNADRIFTDCGNKGIHLDKQDSQSRWGGIFPSDLYNYENYWINNETINLMSNIMLTFENKQKDVFDIYATKDTILEWYKIKSSIKNNLEYKQWMMDYCNSLNSNYPMITKLQNF